VEKFMVPKYGSSAREKMSAQFPTNFFLSIFGKFWTVVEDIEGKFCMHVETDEFENSKRFISQMTTPI
jgi:hypothetical protein